MIEKESSNRVKYGNQESNLLQSPKMNKKTFLEKEKSMK